MDGKEHFKKKVYVEVITRTVWRVGEGRYKDEERRYEKLVTDSVKVRVKKLESRRRKI